jgi:hypothetical protein
VDRQSRKISTLPPSFKHSHPSQDRCNKKSHGTQPQLKHIIDATYTLTFALILK